MFFRAVFLFYEKVGLIPSHIDFDLIDFLCRTSATQPAIRLSSLLESHESRRSRIDTSTSRPPMSIRFTALSFHPSSKLQSSIEQSNHI